MASLRHVELDFFQIRFDSPPTSVVVATLDLFYPFAKLVLALHIARAFLWRSDAGLFGRFSFSRANSFGAG